MLTCILAFFHGIKNTEKQEIGIIDKNFTRIKMVSFLTAL